MRRILDLLGIVLAAFAALAAPAATQETGGPALVFGATGQLGAEIVRAFVAQGRPVTAFARPGSNMDRLAGLNIAMVHGDVLKADDVAAALGTARFAVVVDALARGSAGAEFYDISERNISSAAKAAGVKQVILHSSVGAGKSRAVYPEGRWAAMKDTLLAKEAGENHLMSSGVAFTIIRNAVLWPDGTPATGQARLFEDETKFGPVTRADLARLTVSCAGNTACFNKIYHAVDETMAMPQARR